MRLIDADALKEKAFSDPDTTMSGEALVYVQDIDEAPTIEAEPVRHGRWVMTLYTTTSKRGRVISNKKFSCSECGYGNGRKQSNYCPNCGAKMEGDRHDN